MLVTSSQGKPFKHGEDFDVLQLDHNGVFRLHPPTITSALSTLVLFSMLLGLPDGAREQVGDFKGTLTGYTTSWEQFVTFWSSRLEELHSCAGKN